MSAPRCHIHRRDMKLFSRDGASWWKCTAKDPSQKSGYCSQRANADADDEAPEQEPWYPDSSGTRGGDPETIAKVLDRVKPAAQLVVPTGDIGSVRLRAAIAALEFASKWQRPADSALSVWEVARMAYTDFLMGAYEGRIK